MEIEAKFILPDAASLQKIQAWQHLAGFCLADGQTLALHDVYLDSAERHILAAGFACRQRQQPDGVMVALKGLGDAQSAVHRRQEMQTLLPGGGDLLSAPLLSLDQWPPGALRERVQQIVGSAPLLPLVALQQIRIVRPLSQGQRLVGELCLDTVCLLLQGCEQVYFELEVELGAAGDERDLSAIVNCLQDEWKLTPQTRSKFERALLFLQEKGEKLC